MAYNTINIRFSNKNRFAFTNKNFISNANVTTNIINNNKIEVTSSNVTYANAKFLVSELGGDIELEDGAYTFSVGKVTNSNSNMNKQLMTLSTYTNGSRAVIDNILVGTPKTINIVNAPNKRYVLEFWGSYDTALINTATFENVQIEKGTSFTDFVEHKEQNYPLSLGDLEFADIDNNKDTIIRDNTTGKWYKNANIVKVLLTGNEAWSYYAAALVFFTNDYSDLFATGVSGSDINIYSNNYKGGYYSQKNNVLQLTINNGRLHLRDDRYTSVEDLKDWLSSSNTYLYAKRATPANIEITDTTLISQLDTLYEAAMSYQEQTNVSQDGGDLPFILDITAMKQLS